MRAVGTVVALLGLAAALAGCGIGPGPVVSHGQAQPKNQPFDQYSSADLVRPESISNPSDLVERYLSAAADKLENRVATLRTYMVDKNWTPGTEINIYRVDDIEDLARRQNITPVSVEVQKIGALKDGRIEPVAASSEKRTFNVVHDPTRGLLLQDVPPELMLSEKALALRFDFRPIYFWDKDVNRLVPDLRYVPRYLTEAEKARQLIEWLYAGPSAWLAPAVKGPPAALLRPGSPVHTTDGTLVVDFQPVQLPAAEFAKLTTQLERTLQSGKVTGVQLKIQGQHIPSGKANVVDDSKSAARFAVQQEKVVRLLSGSDRGDSAVPLSDQVNQHVVWAVFSRREEAVAIVQQEGGVQRFLIGPSGAPKPVQVSNKPIDQAAWLDGESRSALVLSDRRLYEVSVDGQKVTQLSVLNGGLVSSFSVMPDGRLVMVIGGRLWIAVLYRNPESLAISQPQLVPTTLSDVRQVAFSNRHDLVIAGVGIGKAGAPELLLTAINIDGSQQQPAWMRYGPAEQTSHLTTDFRTSITFYDYGGAVHTLQPGGGLPLPNSQVVRSGPSATPAASTAPAPPITAASFEG